MRIPLGSQKETAMPRTLATIAALMLAASGLSACAPAIGAGAAVAADSVAESNGGNLF